MAKVAKIPFGKSIREIVGTEVTLEIAFNPSPPEYPMTPFLTQALATNPRAKRNWENLLPSRQKEIARYFSRLKTDEAKERNRRNLVDVLMGKERRFIGRLWRNGS
jgi:uncharacterized protein YdeI (YjbR/CyaY-like superfamily)